MNKPSDERQHRVRQQAIEVEHEHRKYELAVKNCRWGTRRIVAEAREKIAELKFERDEARLRLRREREHLEHLRGVAANGFEQ